MYKVKVDEKLLCFTGSVNGMEYVTDPDVKLVVNGVDSFSFAIYPQHPLYRKIECKVSRVKIWRDSELLFYGEVTGYSRDMYGIRTYDCEGALAWLNDLHFSYAISGATPKDVLYWYIKMYNQKLRDKSKSFELGTVTVHKAMTQDGTEGTIARSNGVYPSFWEEIQDKLLDSFGGILRVRYVGSDTCAGYIDWLAIPDGTCTQDVRYAKNLLNCDWTYDCTALATAVVPLGKRKDSGGDNEVRLTIDKADDDDATFMIQYMTGTDDLVKSGNMVYSKSRMEKYGLIQQAITFDDITDAGTLAHQGAVWLRQNGKAASTIRAEAIDLADIDESVEHFTHGDYVRTKLPGDSAESLFPITAIEIPIAAPENAKLTVGTQESGITSGSGGQGGGSIADAGSGADATAHTHSNKGVLDKITEQDYSDFKGTVNKAHVHSNKGTLDKITDVVWNTVYGYTHSHDNKAVLDKTTASYTAADKKKLDGIAAGATKVAVDSALSATSTNPVQNKAVKAALDSKSASGHTHAMITNSALWVSGANNTAKWVKLGTLVSSGNFSNAIIRVWSGDGANGRANQNSSFEVQIKDGWQSTESATKACGVTVYRVGCSSVKVKVIPTAHDTYTVWAYMPWGYWNGNYAIYGKYKSWTYQHLIQSEEPEGTGADTAYYDHAFLTSTVAKATEATTLTDSGWQKPTFPSGVKSSSIRYRKQGKIVSVTGYVQFSAEQTTITVFTLPTGYRPPAKIQQFNAVDSSAQASFLTKIDTDGKVGFFGKTRGFFTTATEYYMHCTFFVD